MSGKHSAQIWICGKYEGCSLAQNGDSPSPHSRWGPRPRNAWKIPLPLNFYWLPSRFQLSAQRLNSTWLVPRLISPTRLEDILGPALLWQSQSSALTCSFIKERWQWYHPHHMCVWGSMGPSDNRQSPGMRVEGKKCKTVKAFSQPNLGRSESCFGVRSCWRWNRAG